MTKQEILRALQAGKISLEEARKDLIAGISPAIGAGPTIGASPLLQSSGVPSDLESPAPILGQVPKVRSGAIAIVGMSGKYPDARNLSEYWENLVQGKNAIREIPLSRFSISDYYDQNPAATGKISCQWLGALDEIEYFDPLFFHLSPAEAEVMDPQQRLFLEEGYKAFEDAGYSPGSLSNRKCGVYLGIVSQEYGQLLSQQKALEMNIMGTSSAIAAARIAYLLNLKGPAIAIDTACSSSLVATHLACQALRCQEIDLALVGGVTLCLTSNFYIGMCNAGMLSPDGQCKTFDASANGFVPGEGVGALVLKRLADAEADYDQIYGVIIGSGINQDGATNGITAPSVKSQSELEREIYEKYQIDPTSISYVETHGTGTKLGDPIELQALSTVFQEKTQCKRYCAIGSVKSNIGHTMAAAGVASLQKVLLAMKHKKLVPTLHFERPNEHFNFEASPFYVNTEVQDWKSGDGSARRAAVSSFGFSGTNAHLVVEEYLPARNADRAVGAGSAQGTIPTAPARSPYDPRAEMPYLFVLSAQSEPQLKSYAQEMKRWIQAHAEQALPDIAFTCQVGRAALDYRLAIVASSREVLLQRLERFVDNQSSPEVQTAQVKKGKNDATLFEPDADGQSLLHIWYQKKNLEKIAQVWVRGVNVDWRLLYEKGLPHRVSLPTYPFARERYWISSGTGSTQGPIEVDQGLTQPPHAQPWTGVDQGPTQPPHAQPSTPTAYVIHPLVQRNTSTLWEQRFSSTFRGDEFFLADHVIKGQRIMPGVAYLEMARAAVREALGTEASHEPGHLHLSHVVWTHPLTVGVHPVTVHLSLFPQESGMMAFVISRAVAPELAGEEIITEVYCQGQAELRAESDVQSLDLPTIQTRCLQQISVPEIYQRYRELGLTYGPAYQGIEQMSGGEGEILARFRLPAAPGLAPGVAQTRTEGDRRDGAGPRPHPYVLHPSVLDAALHAYIGLLIKQNSQVPLQVPFALSDLSIENSLPTQGWVWIRRSPQSMQTEAGGSDLVSTLVLDVEVCDDAGRVAVRLRGLSLRPFLGSLSTLRTLLLTPDWKEEAVVGPASPSSPEDPTPDLTLAQAPLASHLLVLLCGLPDILASRIQAQITSGGRCRSLSSSHLRREQRFQDVAIQLIQELQHLLQSALAGSVQVQVVVAHREEASLLEALAGALKAAEQEYPQLQGQLIEIEGEPEEGKLLAYLHENQLRMPQEPHICYRDGKRWVRAWQEHPLVSAPVPIPWKEGGCYLISGGAGRLARHFVEEIARQVEVATIILFGRSALEASQRAQGESVVAGGIHIDYQQVDVTDGAAVHALIRRVLVQYGHLDGIIHAAGVLRDSLLLNKTQEEVLAVLSPKVIGVEQLDEASAEIPLDFFVLCSSLAAVAGNVGQADYAVANAYLDAFAHARAARVLAGERQGKTLSINWPYWEAGGMHMDASTLQMMRERLGLEVLETETGMKTLYQALAENHAQVVVLHGQVERIKEQWLRRSPASPVRGKSSLERTPSGSTIETQQGVSTLGEEVLGEKARAYFKKHLAALIKLPALQIEASAPLEDYGFDSIMAIRFTNLLEKDFGPLSKTLLFEHPTLDSVTEYFLHHYPEQLRRVLGVEEAAVTTLPQATGGRIVASPTPSQAASLQPGLDPHHRLALLRKGTTLFPAKVPVVDEHARQDKAVGVGEIAIIGVAGRYPGARDLHAFWENLRTGRDCITEIPLERWDYRLYFDPDKNKPGTTYSKWGGFLDGVDEFDPLFFNISPREAERMDPQERLFLECAFATLEDAGYTRSWGEPKSYDRAVGSNGLAGNVGVFVGVMYEEYQLFAAQAQMQGQPVAVFGNPSAIANRVSYCCNFHGPSLAVDTACSSSLTVIHLACQSISNGDCALAIAGGVNISIHPNKYLLLSQGQFVSSKGSCQSFGVGADGYVPGEGVGAVLLKPLAQAEADGDHIYGVIKATAINHGGKTNGYTVPNPVAQARVIEQTIKKAGIDPRTISYIEAHGTGTVLGDPIEIAGLTRAFEACGATDNVASGQAQGTVPTAPGWCAIGSVKSNIGHAESAAGIAGVTKVLLQMRYGQLVPSLHTEVLNPHIDFSATPFVVQQELSAWERPQMPNDRRDRTGASPVPCPRRAGISSFGAGGSNAHVILEEYVPEQEGQEARNPHPSRPALIVLSARSGARLYERVQQLLAWIEDRSLWESHTGGSPTDAEGSVVQVLDQGLVLSFLDNLAYTLQVGREAMKDRLAFQVSSLAELEEKLKRYLQEPQEEGEWYLGQVKQYKEMVALFSDNEDIQEFVREWLQKGKYEKLLQWWVKGGNVDWRLLYTVGASQRGQGTGSLSGPLPMPRRISLPTYPFARERYWLSTPSVEPIAGNRAAATSPTGSISPRSLGTAPFSTHQPIALRPLADDSVPSHGETDDHQRGGQEQAQDCSIKEKTPPKPVGTEVNPVPTRISREEERRTGAGPRPGAAIHRLEEELVRSLAQALGMNESEIDREAPFVEMGVDSIVGVEWIRTLNKQYGLSLSATKLYAYPTLHTFARLLAKEGVSSGARWHPQEETPTTDAQRTITSPLPVPEWPEQPDPTRFRTGAVGTELAPVRVPTEETSGGSEPETPSVVAMQEIEPGIVQVTMQDRVQKNLFSAELVAGLIQAFQAIEESENAKVVILTGYDSYFASGGSREALLAIQQGHLQFTDVDIYSLALDCKLPVIAAMQGHAVGGGWSLGMFCDFLIMSRESYYASNYITYGFTPGAGATLIFPEKLGASLAQEVLYTGKHFQGSDLEAKGVSFAVCPRKDVLANALQLARDLAQAPREALIGLKELLAKSLRERVATAYEREVVMHQRTFVNQTEVKARIEASFGWSAEHAGEQQTGQVSTNQEQGHQEVGLVAASIQKEDSSQPLGKSMHEPEKQTRQNAIAIIGMSGRYPEARNLSDFWENLAQGKNAIREVPRTRFDISDRYDPDQATGGKISCKWLGSLEDIEYFDPLFFHISPREAQEMDPQHRLFLEEGYKTLEDAGYGPELLSNKKCGVYLGILSSEYGLLLSVQKTGEMNLLGSSTAIAAARLPYLLNLKGPAMPIDTACSSSLVATHLACQALRDQEIDMALVGGVSLCLTSDFYVGMCTAGMLSPDGQCKTFDASANGFVPGEGVGALVLKRLADAEADHDQIYGVIVGSGINQDGATNGITAPNLNSQMELEREIYEKYAIDPASLSYVEMHGTGTELGDPIELEALSTVFQERTRRKQYCAIGSVKTNIGHTMAAAGVAGLQKVLLAMQRKKLVPTLNFQQPNPHFDFEASPFYVNTEVQDWKSEAGGPLRAAVSSFGFSGTNAHLVVEEYLPAPSASCRVEDGFTPSRPLRSPGACLFVLSAKNEPQLKSYAQDMKRWIQAHAEQALPDIAFTLQVGRAALDYRLAIEASSREVLLQRLEGFVDNQTSPGVQTAQVKKGTNDATLFEADADGQSLLHIWYQKKDLEKIAQIWVRGVNVDWRLLYEKGLPRRVSLPTYPFARERYWLPTPKVERNGHAKTSAIGAYRVEGGDGPRSRSENPQPMAPHRVVLQPLADHPLLLRKEVDQSQPSISPSLSGQSFSPSSSNGVVASRDTGVSLTIEGGTMATPDMQPAPRRDSALRLSEEELVTPDMQMALSVDHEPTPQLEEELVRSLAEALSMEQSDIDVDKPFGEIGLDSVIGVEWVQSLNKQYASNLRASSIYDYPTIRQLAAFLKKEVFEHQQTFVQSIAALSLDDVLQQLQQGTVDLEKAEQLVQQVFTRANKEDY